MSAVLMSEILDHYHGSAARKMWLLSWAEKAATETRSGWCPRAVIAARVGVSRSRVSHIAAELVAEGTLKRDGSHRRYAVYVLSPLVGRGRYAEECAQGALDKGAPWAHSSRNVAPH